MLKLWIAYNILIIALIFGTSISHAQNLSNYLLPLLLLPLLYYLCLEILKPRKKHKLSDPTVFAADLTTPTASLAIEGEVMPNNISDDNRRLFLKLVGSTGLSVVIMAIFGKKSAQAAFFGSVPGPGTVAVKNIAGDTIDPAEKQSTDGYEISQVDDSSTPSYYGFVHKTGAWYITKEDATGAYRYAKGSADFATGWTTRVGLAYDYFDNTF
ncbi:MAG: hypothetical protein WAV40_02100 [Microgenomates group bacterium]